MKAEINDILFDFQASKICIGEASNRLEAYAKERVIEELEKAYNSHPEALMVCDYLEDRIEELKQK